VTSKAERGRLTGFVLPEQVASDLKAQAQKLGCPQALIVQGLVEMWLQGEILLSPRTVRRPKDPRTVESEN
jgi:hypothetical protein